MIKFKKVLCSFLILFPISLLISCNFDFFSNSTEDTNVPAIPTQSNDISVNDVTRIYVSSNNDQTVTLNHKYTPTVQIIGVYSNNVEVDITNSVIFSSVDTSSVGNKTVSVTYGNLTTSFIVKVVEPIIKDILLAYSNIKVNYKIGESFDSTGLYVYGCLIDDSYELLEDYSISIYDSNGNLYTNTVFNTEGSYKVIIKYNTFEKEYLINVTLNHIDDTDENQVISSISLDTSNTLTTYNIGDELNTTGLCVYANYEDNSIDLIEDYTITIFDENNDLLSSTTFNYAGTYTIRITYDTFNTEYTVTVTPQSNSNDDNNDIIKDTFNIEFGISGVNSEGCTVTLKKHEPVNPLELISDIIPNGYLFMGFGGIEDIEFSWDDPDSEDDMFLKVYVCKNKTDQYHVAYLNPNYEYITYSYYSPSTYVTDLPSYSGFYDMKDYVFVSWDTKDLLSPVRENCIVFANLAKDAGGLLPIVSTSNIGEVEINLGLDDSFSYNYYLTISDDIETLSIVNNDSTFSLNLNSTYTISGMVTYKDEGNLYVKKINYSFDNVYYEALENLNEDDIQMIAYSNGFVIGTQEYVEVSPIGYSLYSLCLYNEANELISELLYNEEFSLTFYNIEEGNYRIDPIYERVEEENILSTCSFIVGDNSYITQGYRIHFVGFWVHYSKEGDPLCKVELYYDNEILYTHYYAKGEYPRNVFTFTLPIKYDGYYVAGSLDYVSEINEDQKWELLLVKRNINDGNYNVFFIGADKQEIISYQEVSSEDEIQIPNDDLTYIEKNNLYKYIFIGWNSPKLTSNTYYYPIFERVIIDESTCQYEPVVYVETDRAYISWEMIGYTFYNTMNFYLIGGKYLTKTKINSGLLEGLKINTTYTLIFEYSFKVDVDQTITKQKELSFTTLEANFVDETNDYVYVTDITYATIYVSNYDDSIACFYKWSNEYEFTYSSYNGFKPNNHEKYLLTYFKEFQDGVYYAYDNLYYSTLDIPYPEIEFIDIKEDSDNYYFYISTPYAYEYSKETILLRLLYGNEMGGIVYDDYGNILFLTWNIGCSFIYDKTNDILVATLSKYYYVSAEYSPDGEEHYYINFYDFTQVNLELPDGLHQYDYQGDRFSNPIYT